MTSREKIELLKSLRKRGIIRELCPERRYWHYEVLRPEELPESLMPEFNRLGELRW